MAAIEIQKQCMALAKAADMQFSINGSETPYRDVFSLVGMLPAIAQRADQLCSLCLGYGIGIAVEDQEKSMLGKKVDFDDMTPDSLRLLFILDILLELKAGAAGKKLVPLEELVYD